MDNFWEISKWEEADKHLVGVQQMPFQRPFAKIQLKPGLYSLRGPRQIGKSSWVTTLLSQVCREQSPQRAFYMSCENLSDHKDLDEILKVYKRTRDFIFLDEVPFVTDWARPVKHLIDEGYKGVVLVTGSNLLDLRSGVDRMPGREGYGSELTLLPMNFDEFVLARRNAGWSTDNRLEELKKYFRIGGFPIAVAEAGSQGTSTSKTTRVIEKWILGDLARLGKNEDYAKEILSQVSQTLTSQLSTQKLAQRTQIGSHHTVADYLKVLEDMFVLSTLYSIDPNTGGFRFKKEKKYYLNDPLYVRLGLEWMGLGDADVAESALAELVAHEHLRREHQRFGFLTSAKGGEVDFYSHKKWAREIKWSQAITDISESYKNLRIVDKKVWTQENFLK